MVRLGIDPREIEVVVLSDGHWDHVTGMEGLARMLGRRGMPVVLHPECCARRRLNLPGQDPAELPVPSRGALAGLGFELREDPRASFPLDGAALILDDQALVLRLRDAYVPSAVGSTITF